MYNGIIIADSPPSHVTGYAWIKVKPDNSREWYHFDKDVQEWVLDSTEPAPALPSSVNGTFHKLKNITIVGGVITACEGDT